MSQQRFDPSDISTAESYERQLVPAIFERFATPLIEAVALQPGERVLDIACGTGAAARAAARAVGSEGKVVGLDGDPNMLVVARRLPSPGAPLEWQEGNAQALPFAPGSFDVVLCQQGLQFFPDKPGALREMHRVLVTDGRLGISVSAALQRSPGMSALTEALVRHVGQPAVAFVSKGIFGLSDEQELHNLIADAGFHDVLVRTLAVETHFASVEQFVTGVMRVGPLAAMTGDQLDAASRAAIVGEVNAALQPYVTDAGCSFPIYISIATAHR